MDIGLEVGVHAQTKTYGALAYPAESHLILRLMLRENL